MAKSVSINEPKVSRTEERREPHEQHELSRDDIARRAYGLYEARGREPGQDMDDWLRAEKELREQEVKE